MLRVGYALELGTVPRSHYPPFVLFFYKSLKLDFGTSQEIALHFPARLGLNIAMDKSGNLGFSYSGRNLPIEHCMQSLVSQTAHTPPLFVNEK